MPIKETEELIDYYFEVFTFRPVGKPNGKRISISYAENQYYRWAISYCGNSHFFNTLGEVLAYSAGRRFIKCHMRDQVEEQIISKAVQNGIILDNV